MGSVDSRQSTVDSAFEFGLQDLARPLELRLDTSVDLAGLAAHDRAAAAHATLLLHLEVLDAAQLLDQAVDRVAHDRHVRRVDLDRDPLPLDQTAQGAADDVDDALGLSGDRAG